MPRPCTASSIQASLSLSLYVRPPHAFYFFYFCYFYRDTQQEPLRRREQALCLPVTYPRRTARRLARTTWPETHRPRTIMRPRDFNPCLSLLSVTTDEIVSALNPRTYRQGVWMPPFSKVFLSSFYSQTVKSQHLTFSVAVCWSFARILSQVW